MCKYINSGKPGDRRSFHISEDVAVANGIRYLNMLASDGISEADVTLVNFYRATDEAERILRLCDENTKMPRKVRDYFRRFASGALDAIDRTWTFRGPGNGRDRAFDEITFRLNVARRILEALGYDIGDLVA